MKQALLILSVLSLSVSYGYKILLVFPLPVRSLNLLGEGYVKHLHAAGHEITYVTVYPLKNKPEHNFTQIDISTNTQLYEGEPVLNISEIMTGVAKVNDIQELHDLSLAVASLTFNHDNVQKLLRNTSQHFDLVIADLIESDLYPILGALYDCPFIWAYSMGTQWYVLRTIDQAPNPAYTVDGIVSSNVPPLNFIQRIQELLHRIEWYFVKRFITIPKEKEFLETFLQPLFTLRGKSMPTYEDVVQNISLIFSNENTFYGNIPSIPQNFKFISGQHIHVPHKPLPKDLQTFMDNAKEGVIYFSMGSTWKSKDIPESVTRGLLSVFGELKHPVIWKYEAELTNVPKNVHILKWAPQQSILAHPNCLFFITHGGLLSSLEAIHFGIPIIGMPIYFDQFININKAVARGFGLHVKLNFDLAANLKKAIHIMLEDDKYRKKAKELSIIYHDRPVQPGAELVHWAEHVIRTRGAPHLRSPSLLVPWYQKLYLDLLALVVAVIILLCTVVKYILCNRKRKDVVKKNK